MNICAHNHYCLCVLEHDWSPIDFPPTDGTGHQHPSGSDYGSCHHNRWKDRCPPPPPPPPAKDENR